ncbi:hypothetical protein F8S13_25010 [Chloroflexia bacterium SDU3-3]|nr:hypothetical protein F8S13_25010 [Chloroflexia bacterium SDU3-3]
MHLFSPLSIGPTRLPNRIVFAGLPSGHASRDGSISPAFTAFYAARAAGGAGAVVLESAWPLAPSAQTIPHLGLYHDRQIADLGSCIERIHSAGSCALVQIDQPIVIASLSDEGLGQISKAWIAAAQRACSAGADGVLLSCVDGGPFQQLLSPLTNQRAGRFGGPLDRRMQLLQDTVERMHARFSARMVVGLRLLVEEFTPGGVTLQDARVIARRMSIAGARLVEVFAPTVGAVPMAYFPGWRTPLAAAIRAVVDVPVMVGDLNDDPEFANSVLADRCADLVCMGEVLRDDAAWPKRARAALFPDGRE